jgi:hypothetical protein
MIVNQTPAAVRYVFGPKAVPSRLIDSLSVSAELTTNLYASSIASILGGMGQSNYAAANAYMNSIAGNRTVHGLKSTALTWGAVVEVGMASRLDAATSFADQFTYLSITEVQTVMRRCGFCFMPPSHFVVTPITG